MDALSDVLQLIRLTGGVFLNAEFTHPWLVRTRHSRKIADVLMPEAEHMVEYHLIVEGNCYAKLEDGEPVLLETGDVVMFPHGEAHLLGSDLSTPAVPTEELLGSGVDDFAELRYGGGGQLTRLVCGFLACDRTLCSPLLATMPRLLKVSSRGSEAGAWLETYMRFSVAERIEQRAGGACILAKLSELMFVEAIRRHIESLPADRTGWLAGLRDTFISRALALLHGKPARPWTVEDLGKQVGLSRSALAERFTYYIGQPPMQYLTQWRLSLAAHQLRTTGRPIAAIAEEVGYDSEAAFNRAFKREFGAPPATWRKSVNVPAASLDSLVA